MVMLVATIAILFGIGFSGGYLAREALSWARRSKLKKQRAGREADMLLKQSGAMAPQSHGNQDFPAGSVRV